MKMGVRQLPTLEFKYKDNRSVSNTATLLGVFGKLPKYFAILRQLDHIVRETQPDVIINFFEPMAAFYTITRRKRPPVVAIGHQFMFQHPDYVRAAHDFIGHPPAGAETLQRPNGDRLIYDPAGNVFAVVASDGAPRTLFKPRTGAAYWTAQQARAARDGEGRQEG